MSITGAAIWLTLFIGAVFISNDIRDTVWAITNPRASLLLKLLVLLMILPCALFIQHLGINMGMWLMYHGQMLVAAGGY